LLHTKAWNVYKLQHPLCQSDVISTADFKFLFFHAYQQMYILRFEISLD